ncbi:N-acyl homoserine lactonase family protein [Rhodococcus koreensis]|uniref:N-acyl homoserine lactonase family protein n=1 Tax=Rhodococcus koreensis TaxID=99653 RepID=UPI003672BD76
MTIPVEMYALTCGEITISYPSLRSTETGMLRVPVTSYLIVHPHGQVLFDSGMSPQIYDNYGDYVPEYAKKDRQFHFGPGEDVAARLQKAGFDPTAVDLVVNSHLHHDHCGGNSLLPNADILVQGRELDHARKQPDDTMAYRKADFETGQHLRTLDGEHDIFGDGALVCVPTNGHTPGHQSLRVSTEAGTWFLCGDACYLTASLDDLVLPLNVTDSASTLTVLENLQAMRNNGVHVLVGHDPEFWKTVPQAPDRIA